MSSYAEKKARRAKSAKEKVRGVKFERHASQIVFDPVSLSFVVTWAKCNRTLDERLAKRAPAHFIPSIVSIATLFDRGLIDTSHVVYAAKSVGAAWKAGDRDGLDTEEAKKAVELVSDLSSMCVNPSSTSVSADIGQAFRHMLDELAAVRFLNTPIAEFKDEAVLPALDKAVAECICTAGFLDWPAMAKRRRMLFCLNRKERTEVTYTIVSMLFDTGSCPLLSLSDRRIIRMHASKASGLGLGEGSGTYQSFFRYALLEMREMRESDTAHVSGRLSPKEMLDIVSGASSPSTASQS